MIITGDCLEEMKKMKDNSISCIVTDPPYGLGFMKKQWDAGLPQIEIWKEALRIVKPGGHILAFGGTRTYHRLTCAIEDAGWEIRDCLQWIYGSGFPKSHNNFGLEGYGTALKPAHEPIIMAMKPIEGTFKENAEKWGQAGINIEACRIVYQNSKDEKNGQSARKSLATINSYAGKFKPMDRSNRCEISGRWPTNIIIDEEAERRLDEQSEIVASRFFYCAKSSSSEKNEGLEGLEDKIGGGLPYDSRTGKFTRQKNIHPTVKPLKLMEYLIKLVMPPKNGILLDPFAGSGSTILAAHRLGIQAIGIEKCEEYAEIARARINNCIHKRNPIQLEFDIA